MRKDLCASGLITAIYQKFLKISDPKKFTRINSITIADCLMSCFAIFNLKWPSLLQYEEEKKSLNVLKNFKNLFHVNHPPSDTYMRERLDEIDPKLLRPAFKKVFSLIQRGKALEQYSYLDGYYLFSSDGTGLFYSKKIQCSNCCIKNHYDGSKTFFHNMLAGVIVHPDKKEVIPFCPEPIQKQDGIKKNDCEQSASKRQLEALHREHPHLKIIIVQDALGNSGPNIQQIEELSMKYIIVRKGRSIDFEDEKYIVHHEVIDSSGTIHSYRFINNISLNGVHSDIKTNAFEHISINAKGKKKKCTWITNIKITIKNVHTLMRGGRARWKIENETFNTLKNQGYHFEHNFGHGHKNLCTVMSYLMFLAFLIDQAQLIACKTYQEAKNATRTFYSLWEKMRTFFIYLNLKSWENFLNFISRKVSLNSS